MVYCFINNVGISIFLADIPWAQVLFGCFLMILHYWVLLTGWVASRCSCVITCRSTVQRKNIVKEERGDHLTPTSPRKASHTHPQKVPYPTQSLLLWKNSMEIPIKLMTEGKYRILSKTLNKVTNKKNKKGN